MSQKDNDQDQTLIAKDDKEQWYKVLHGEIAPDADNKNHINAAKIRSYLLTRDEVTAVNSVDDEYLDTISAEEARVIYRRTVEEAKRRGGTSWRNVFKTYGVGILIGGLSVYALLLTYGVGNRTSESELADHSHLNFSDYPALNENENVGTLPNMLLIPGGVTNKGCSKGWDDLAGGCRPTEFPPHAVTVEPFLISQHEVTYGQFRKFIAAAKYITDAERENRGCVHEDTTKPGGPFVMKPELTWESPGYYQDDSYPVTCVSWSDAQNYIAWLSKETKTSYRLPSESEWEHAARGGKATAYHWGSVANNNQANYSGESGKDLWKFASPVGQFPANKFSVQDTSGNLWEWVQDCWHDTYDGAPVDGSAWEVCNNNSQKVRRGGSWDMNAAGIRSAIRSKGAIHDRSNLYGFRVASDWQNPNK
ncbi:formylglycine-generating enzyme family protein [Leucothrix arctica]|uniref:Sulfatase-modifying factor enzyme-like domain-containing protein n=1 Tax=Leucothrix arctica TaxID=1481894 RepID=A0A317CCZ1_9GAMM|nr:formylglycine-generating enzyme family protein [Leucothrix arctica]PWQ93962.1 hypothetical protein DKT75_20410 [Leucothrix arctica]